MKAAPLLITAALSSLMVVLSGGFDLARAAAPNLTVSWDAAAVTRGAVVPIEVASPVNLEAAEAVAGAERFSLWKTGEGRYLALVGIDLGYTEPVYQVDFEFYPSVDEEPYRIRADLKVRGREFAAQSLSLPTGMVDFSEEDSVRVREESLVLGAAIAVRTPDPAWQKGFVLPVKGRISTAFGSARVLNGQQRSPHGGVDIAAAEGVPVGSANDGVVLLTADMFLSGRTVAVDHGWGVVTLYAHLSAIEVEAGQRVARGQVIGRIGSTGRATGPHLHFASFLRSARVDPLSLIRAAGKFKIQD